MKAFSFLCALVLAACSNQESHKIPIAILMPVTHPSLEQAEKGFKETMEKESPGKYRFVTYNAQGNKTLMRGEVEEIAQKGYPLVFTLGTMSSQMTVEVFNKKGIKTPIVFTCVSDPSNLLSEQVTGVKEVIEFKQELAHLLQYKPDLKRLLLVLNPMEPGIAQETEQVKVVLKEKGLELITAEVFQTNEFMAKVSPLMDKADAMLVLKDNTVVGGIDILVKLCNQHKIPLIASDLDSPDRGAAFGYGVREIEFGIEGAKKALEILETRVAPNQIPVTPVSNFTFKVNKAAAKEQGIP
jgi:putative ABC transport system substrate-binding protein